MRKDLTQYIFLSLLSIITTVQLAAQKIESDTLNGEVSYKTSQSIYVSFNSTEGISEGDTLYSVVNASMIPVLTVKYLSSRSCVGIPISDQPLAVGAKIIAKSSKIKIPPHTPAEVVQEQIPGLQPILPEDEEAISEEIQKKPVNTEKISGRISAASYVYFSDHPENDKQRMRYTFNLNAKNISNTGFSAESYISFRHTLNEWQEVKDHFGKTFKVYNLAVQYNIDNRVIFWLGRKINFNISNVGAIDGIQAEKKWNKTLVGMFAGFRPDHQDYGFNDQLLQFGAYAGYKSDLKNGSIQNTLAVAEQRNSGMTDRRFIYFQHLNSAIRDIYIFTSFEFDLYTLDTVDNSPKNTFDITSLYASVRYRPTNKLSLFVSYDARKNIIYYETYKNILDQLLEDETRQGLRFSINYKPFKKITIGSNAGYRFEKNTAVASKNLYSYLTISRIPKLNMSATLTTVWIQSPYLDGLIYGLRISRDLVKGKLFGEASYRIVDYKYKSTEYALIQSIVGLNLSWRITRKISLSVNYEGEIRESELSNRIYSNIIHRF